MALDIHVFRTLSDNTGALLRDPASGICAAVDVPDAEAVLAAAKEKGWEISRVLVTHEHADHVQGIAALKQATGAQVFAPAAAREGAPVDTVIAEGDSVSVGDYPFAVWATPGHAEGHLSLVSSRAALALVGDVVFVMGCGRVMPGRMEAMWTSVSRIMELPEATTLITGHDYTLSNARFAAAMDPANPAVASRLAEAEAAKESGRFWSVTTVGEEKASNPFFRAGQEALAATLGLVGKPAGAVFAALREAKNRF
ncbi:hydroxyacylglutathione hydrolase [Bosea sp. TWI1241]|uniref:hydroxyacylglutathione hydrolase n=1 Tax=Bosea sp. TWI1241 TaxID=3148904 RepID=UPI003209A016